MEASQLFYTITKTTLVTVELCSLMRLNRHSFERRHIALDNSGGPGSCKPVVFWAAGTRERNSDFLFIYFAMNVSCYFTNNIKNTM